MLWDLFCRVVDNFGDIGVCWRLAAQLGARGQQVRLWVDDPAALAWMAPAGAPGVQVVHWTAAAALPEPGAVVVEAFGCDPPAAFVRKMAQRPQPPRWINLEYLSAEAYVERSHGLPSPQLAGPASGLVKQFFFPGFTPRTGGLLREADLLERRRRFDPIRWLAARGIEGRDGERRVSLFCYENPALPALIDRLAATPTLLLTCPGPATDAVAALLGPQRVRGALRAMALPWLSQAEYDHLLWACDLNLVRGEDSFVRAQWAGRPFVWHLYPQNDGVHLTKMDAFLQIFTAGRDDDRAAALRAWTAVWNGAPGGLAPLPDLAAWRGDCAAWCDRLAAQPDLVTRLFEAVAVAR
jgi:uncharacterized repeat protein (TIGR03837 family)